MPACGASGNVVASGSHLLLRVRVSPGCVRQSDQPSPPPPVNLRITLALLALAGTDLHAQLGHGDGFLFRTPTFRLALAAGYAAPRAQSDIYDLLTTEFTLNKSDFASATFNLSAGVHVTPRLEVGLSGSWAGRTADSESRDFIGEDNLPVLQSTTLDRTTIMATARLSLLEPGRAIGRYAWIPNRVVPYIGGGAGAVRYSLRQKGEFVDKETLDIFADTFESSGWSLGALGLAGTDISLSPRFGLTLEGRYLLSRATMNGDFSTFNKIDLSGYDASLGLFVRF